MKKSLSLALALILALSAAACSSKAPAETAAPETASQAAQETTTTAQETTTAAQETTTAAQETTAAPSESASETAAPAKSLTVADIGYTDDMTQDQVIAGIQAASKSANYSYDDLSKPVTLNVIGTGWVAEPMPDTNPMKQYVKDKLNIDLNVTCYVNEEELLQQVSLRFASQDQPDIAYASSGMKGVQLAVKLASQGLILDNWDPYLQYIPTLTSQINRAEFQIRTSNGHLIGISSAGGNDAPIWQTWIRQDWLDNLHIPTPKTTKELMDAAVAFTFNDPDGNGKADTYGFSDCGGSGGGDLVWHAGTLQSLFAVPGLAFENGQPLPKIINPKWKEALAYQKEMIDKKCIDPDWNTQEWQALYDKIRAGNIGVIYMWEPGAMTVMEGSAGGGALPEPNKRANGEEWKFEDWSLVQTDGYQGSSAWNAAPGMWMISSKAAADQTKLMRIFHYMDFMSVPNEGGVDFGLVAKPAGGKILEAGIGKRVDWSGINPAQLTNYRAYAWCNWQYAQPMLGLLPWYAGDVPEFQNKVNAMQDVCRKIPTYKEYANLVSVPSELSSTFTEMDKYRKQNEIDFMLGRRSLDEWDAYVDELNNKLGLKDIIASYAEQLAVYGVK